jgi:pilus assembly protein Flp/PilA
MKTMLRRITKLFRRQEGATIIEYALLVALLAIVALFAIQAAGLEVKGIFNLVATNLNKANVPPTP